MDSALAIAGEVIARCLSLAECTEEAGVTTRSFLSPPMREVHSRVEAWMRQAGLSVAIDAVGNIRGCRAAALPAAPRLFIGSHLDTVPRAGAYDGILGVVMGIALAELLGNRPLRYQLEVVGFSEEEGLRFGVPFIGSRALVGRVDQQLLERRDGGGVRVVDAVREFGLDPARIGDAQAAKGGLGYLEFHIEQGPVLESLGRRLGTVDAIAGQSRFEVTFTGQTNHAGTTPMHLRRDALAGAAEWIAAVEREARAVAGLVATVGRLQIEPGAANVIAGAVRCSLDVRHADDSIRKKTVDTLLRQASEIGARRELLAAWDERLDQAAVAMDPVLTNLLEQTLTASGFPAQRMISGAGHDAMVIAGYMPAAMLFLRSPGGISHHSHESVVAEDVAAALAVGLRFLEKLDEREALRG